MKSCLNFYINGAWVAPNKPQPYDVINPATEAVIGQIMLGNQHDVDQAVAAAKAAFPSFSRTTKAERVALLEAILVSYKKRYSEMAETISEEMGAPLSLSKAAQAAMGPAHISTAIETLKNYSFEEQRGTVTLRREPIGVCGFITPWNWPINQIACKVIPALAAGCTMVLKPSEVAPLNAAIFAEILHDAGVPPGVFNLVNGDGPTVGNALSSHPDIDMMSFTGSTRAGIQVAKAAADTVKRVSQELGGKSANIILDDADFNTAIARGVQSVCLNSGQSCNAPTRMLVPAARHDEAVAIAKATALQVVVGDPKADTTTIGPVVSKVQFDKIQHLIQAGINEGATLVCGGTGLPAGLTAGYYVQPTIFAGVNNQMIIAREEVFGPVLAILPYHDDEDAIAIANDTVYGLSGYVSGTDPARLAHVANSLRAGNVHVNGAGLDFQAPFGGYKQSGNGREWGEFGMEEFLEVKAVMNLATA
ncbi:MAG: aldehyde dehydrogenase family protein [Gammaproteobacteria bacterium]|nr:aldehyde dehydrogenase family protein [Gammaproteobacteria bacterium]